MEARACGREKSHQRRQPAEPLPPSPGPPVPVPLGGWGCLPHHGVSSKARLFPCSGGHTTLFGASTGCEVRSGLPGQPGTSTRLSLAPQLHTPRGRVVLISCSWGISCPVVLTPLSLIPGSHTALGSLEVMGGSSIAARRGHAPKSSSNPPGLLRAREGEGSIHPTSDAAPWQDTP